MAIPRTISRQNVIDAISEIKIHGIPRQRLPKKWYLSYKGRKYPTKLAISLAHKMARGRSLHPSQFTGGNESNSFLRRLGFSVCRYTPKEAVKDSLVNDCARLECFGFPTSVRRSEWYQRHPACTRGILKVCRRQCRRELALGEDASGCSTSESRPRITPVGRH
jgi:hypothetical protein